MNDEAGDRRKAGNEHVLAPAESDRLAELEAVIRRHVVSFIKVGMALAEIRDQQLYRERYGTFEEYCRLEHGYSRQRGYQIIAASDAARNVNPGLTWIDGQAGSATWEKTTPSEKQARQLARLQPGDQVRIWQDLLSRGQETGKGITTRDVKQEVDALLASRQQSSSGPPEDNGVAMKRQSLDYLNTFKKYAGIIFLERALGWPTTDREMVLRHLRELLEQVEGSGPPRELGGEKNPSSINEA